MANIIKIKNGCNCFLVEKDQQAVLIDTGLKMGADKLIKLGKDKNVKRIILTHGHMDHIQCAKKVAESLQVPILMHEKDLGMITDNRSQPMYGRGVKGKLLAFFSSLGAANGGIDLFTVEKSITAETILQECGMNIEIIELPGHTRGSIGVKIEDHFFVGDALMNIAGAGVSLLYENMDDLMKSAAKITETGDVIIHFGHGNDVKNRQWN